MTKRKKKNVKEYILAIVLIICSILVSYYYPNLENTFKNVIGADTVRATTTVTSFDLDSIPEYSDSPFVYINNNIPSFSEDDYIKIAFEKYSELDSLGRCGVAYANICKELMPTEPRGEIGNVRPSGWKISKYNIVEGKYLYNRCHLIGFQLAGENANEKNLITGTRYLNTKGMLPFENEVANWIRNKNRKGKDYHVLYRVTPIYKGNNLVASGVLMEAKSVEEEGISFNKYIYNVQIGIEINYLTGASKEIK